MTLCHECASEADRQLLLDRVSHKGIPKNEDSKWAINYNKLHKTHSTHSAPKPKGK